jgi:hypothetical protein
VNKTKESSLLWYSCFLKLIWGFKKMIDDGKVDMKISRQESLDLTRMDLI